VLQGHAVPRALGGAVAISILLHVMAIAIAVLAFGRHAPAAEDPAAITVFIPPAPPAEPVAETSEAKPAEPPPPEPDYALPPPEESLAIPDFKSPPPPPPPKEPPPPKAATPPPKPPPPTPKPAPPKPAVAAVPHPAPAAPSVPQQMVPSVNSAPSPSAAPSIAPGWNAQLAAWLAAHKRYPTAARNRSEEGEVQIHFTVEGDGHVSEVTVAKSSGHADLDAAAVTMLQGASVPPPGAVATRTVRIRFHLND
jgi:periplasmic protein TonB